MSNDNTNLFSLKLLKNFLFAFAYFLGMFSFFILFLRYTHNERIFNQINLLNWDGMHYNYIAHVGYTGFRMAFFPFFPFLWKVLGFGTYGIVLFNTLLFVFSTSLLATVFSFSAKEFLLLLSFPSIIFMFLPYTEAMFFFSSSLVLVGMKQKYNWLIFIGMLLASFTRPVVYIFVPSIVVISFCLKDNIPIGKRIFFYIFPVLLGLALVFSIQYKITNDWFAFFHAQSEWKNYFQLPRLIFTSWGGDNIVRLDGSAFLVGTVATIVLVFYRLNRLSARNIQLQESIIFSVLYLAGISWLILFTRGGSLFSLNRFIYATPFFFLGFSSFIKKKWTWRQYILIFILLNAFWLFFGSYVHIQEALKYLSLSVFIIIFLFISYSNKYISGAAYSICLIGNIFLQLYFYSHFLGGGWVG